MQTAVHQLSRPTQLVQADGPLAFVVGWMAVSFCSPHCAGELSASKRGLTGLQRQSLDPRSGL